MSINEQNYEKIVFTFEGNNNVDINLLIKTLGGISESYLNTIKAIEPSATVNLQVEALNQGSFEVIIGSLIENVPMMFQTVFPGVKTFLEILKIKKELKGQKPKSVIAENGSTQIINQQGETHYHDCNITNVYLNNPQIDKSVVDLFMPLTTNTKKGVKLSVDNEILNFKSTEFVEMATPIIEEPISLEATSEVYNEIEDELLLRKPDLMGETKWGFKYDDKYINAAIEDDQFIKKVKNGTIKELYSGVKIPVRMKIIAILNEKLEVVHKKYYILEVIGDIIIPDENGQLQFE